MAMKINYKWIYPSFTFVIKNADQPEQFRDHPRQAPTFFPSPPVLWIPDIPGRKSELIVGAPRLPFLPLPPGWIELIYVEHEKAMRLGAIARKKCKRCKQCEYISNKC